MALIKGLDLPEGFHISNIGPRAAAPGFVTLKFGFSKFVYADVSDYAVTDLDFIKEVSGPQFDLLVREIDTAIGGQIQASEAQKVADHMSLVERVINEHFANGGER